MMGEHVQIEALLGGSLLMDGIEAGLRDDAAFKTQSTNTARVLSTCS